jgi:hypothetical protein
MRIVWPVLVTVAFLAVDARAWVLTNEAGIEGVWVVTHLIAGFMGVPSVWVWWDATRPLFTGKARSGRGGR